MDVNDFNDYDVQGGGHNEDITEKLLREYEEFKEEFGKYTAIEIIEEHLYAMNMWMELHNRLTSEINFDNVNEDILDWCRTVPNIMEHIFAAAIEMEAHINVGSAVDVDESLQIIFVLIGISQEDGDEFKDMLRDNVITIGG